MSRFGVSHVIALMSGITILMGVHTPLIAGIFFVSFIDSLIFGIFILSGSALFALATVALAGGKVSMTAIWFAALIGSFTGDQLSFYLGRATGMLSDRLIHQRRLAETLAVGERWIAKYGRIAIIPGRFITATRKVIPLLLGASPIRYVIFACIDGIACLLWVSFWSLVLYWSVFKGFDIVHGMSNWN